MGIVGIPISINEKLLDSADRPSHKALKGHADLVVELLDDDEEREQIRDRVFRLETLIWWFEVSGAASCQFLRDLMSLFSLRRSQAPSKRRRF